MAVPIQVFKYYPVDSVWQIPESAIFMLHSEFTNILSVV
ncbi:unnamed protein product (macronuclear) [Paramecium tetraurelia]|uniref:Uncharacterized protein n=1 Tax=Paramecium tetraurelia TaxID=5888 RepID=A0DAR7_PARTE|nr:uncharacterized protein GSPATT00015041001 [Paramecium tetraurelia]CAK80134.1 unnamed protein product [Paramecium tetraurelia]